MPVSTLLERAPYLYLAPTNFVCFFFISYLKPFGILYFSSFLDFSKSAQLSYCRFWVRFHLTLHQPQKHCTVTVFFNLLIKGLTHKCVLVFIHAHLHVSSSNASHFNMTFQFGYLACACVCTYTLNVLMVLSCI